MITKITSFKGKSLFIGAFCTLIGLSGFSQDIHFSQIFEAPLDLNPALCGAFLGNFYAEANYKSQWGSVAGSGLGYNTMAATMEFHNMFKKWGNGYVAPGLSFYNDRSGTADIGLTQVDFTLASGIFLDDKNCLSVGLQAGWAQHSIAIAGLQWDDQWINGQYESNAPTNESAIGNSFSYADFSGGIAYHYGSGQTNMTSNDALKFSAGAGIYHINEPQMTYYTNTASVGAGTALYMRYTGYVNMEIGISNTNLEVLPSIVYMQQGPATELDPGVKLRYILNPESKYTGVKKGTALDLGFYYRVQDAAIILVGLEYGNYAMGVSYDFNTSALTTASHSLGGFEISLKFLNVNPFIAQTGPTSNRSMF